jgi:hypothetical protein
MENYKLVCFTFITVFDIEKLKIWNIGAFDFVKNYFVLYVVVSFYWVDVEHGYASC